MTRARPRPALRGLAILAAAFLLGFAVFASAGAAAGSPTLAAFRAGAYALVALTATLLARGLLGLFLDLALPLAFCRALTGITDPLMALFAPMTPGFLHPAFRPFHAAFCLYFLKLLLFGGLGAPPVDSQTKCDTCYQQDRHGRELQPPHA